MRILYYTRPHFLDSALPFMRELSRIAEVHLVLELSPEAWSSSLFDVPPLSLPSGIMPADPVLKDCFPAGVRAYWQGVASFHLLVHHSRRAIHPAAWRISRQLSTLIRSLRPDLLHLDDVSLRLAWALPSLRNIPMVLSLHDPESHSGEQNWRSNLARRLTLGRARHLILHNEALAESFCRRHRVPPAKVSVVPLGVYDIFREWAAPSPHDDGRTVLFFGRLSPYKGLDVLYSAATAVAEQVPNIRFVVAGRPVAGYRPPIAPPLPQGGSIEVIGQYVPNAQLAELFGSATAVVCPYVDATQSGVVLTAYAFGKPVVATRTGGLPEYVQDGETGLLVAPSDSSELASALVRILADAATRGRMAAGICRMAGRKLNWASISKQTEAAYARALAAGG